MEGIKKERRFELYRGKPPGGLCLGRRRFRIYEENTPMCNGVRDTCEILGLDSLYVANKGKLFAFVLPNQGEDILHAMLNHPLGKQSAIIDDVVADHPGVVFMKTRIGGTRIVDMLTGERLPRIC